MIISGRRFSISVRILAAFTNGMRIEALIFLPARTFNLADAVIVGTFMGKREDDHACRNGMATAGPGVAAGTVLTGLVLLNARAIAGLVFSNPVVVEEAVRYLCIAFLIEPLMAWGAYAPAASPAPATRAPPCSASRPPTSSASSSGWALRQCGGP